MSLVTYANENKENMFALNCLNLRISNTSARVGLKTALFRSFPSAFGQFFCRFVCFQSMSVWLTGRIRDITLTSLLRSSFDGFPVSKAKQNRISCKLLLFKPRNANALISWDSHNKEFFMWSAQIHSKTARGQYDVTEGGPRRVLAPRRSCPRIFHGS